MTTIIFNFVDVQSYTFVSNVNKDERLNGNLQDKQMGLISTSLNFVVIGAASSAR